MNDQFSSDMMAERNGHRSRSSDLTRLDDIPQSQLRLALLATSLGLWVGILYLFRLVTG